jgi:hypothetical protein
MSTRPRPDQVEVGVTYWPSGVGPYLWHEFSADVVSHDLASIARRRIPVVRILLSWDAFMPTDRAPNPGRMRDFEILLGVARELGLRIVPTLFAQSLGGCVMLPGYAVDRAHPRRGVRCVTDGRVSAGGPRDIYVDPLMLEVQVRWLDAMLAAFAQHPAIAAWGVGYDPATTVRPRRIDHMRQWAALLCERIAAQGDESRLALGQDDVLTGRAVRLHVLAAHVDRVGMLLRPQRLSLPGAALDPDRGMFAAALARALLGDDAPLDIDVGIAVADDGDTDPAAGIDRDPVAARRAADELLQRLLESGVSGLTAAAWSDWGPRLVEAPPSDRAPSLARLGIVDTTGDSKPSAASWDTLVARDHSVASPQGLGRVVAVDDYYANLPDSLRDLYATWQGSRSDPPAILE